MKPIVLIPSRFQSSRLPGKPLVDIAGKTLIRRVYEEAVKLGYPTYCAIDDERIRKEVESFGGKYIMTDSDLPSGSDRIHQALQKIDPDGLNYDVVINFQGDSANIDYKVNKELVDLLIKKDADITTIGLIMKKEDYNNPAMVKIAAGFRDGETEAKALYFSRSLIPFDRDAEKPKDIYHHVGVYVYKREALKKFVSSPEGILEKREKLEQLRALELGMTIYVKLFDKITIYDNAPADINTPEELELLKKRLE